MTMSDTLRAAAQQALEALDQLTDAVDGTGFSSKPAFDFALDAITALRAALAEPDVPETRFGDMPERLRTYSADTELSDRYSDAMQEAADEIERLGAALAAAVAEPLTDEQIDAMYSASYRTRESDYATNWYWYERGIREAERAHGITKEAP